MQVFDQLITFGSSPVAISIQDGSGNTLRRATEIYAEPINSNTHDCFVEAAGVATGATSATPGVIKALAKPPAANTGTALDNWLITDYKGGNGLDVTQYQFDGTSGEKVRVTITVN